MRKQQLAIEINRIVRSIVKVSVFRQKQSLFSEKIHFPSQHTSCVTYYEITLSFVTSLSLAKVKRCLNKGQL